MQENPIHDKIVKIHVLLEEIMGKQKKQGLVSKAEYVSYGLYFMGQNIFYFIILYYLTTYFTDIGIPALAVSVVALVVKIWDAVNDPIFGGLVDKIKFKKGVFLPWLKISLVGIPITTILMFAIPSEFSPGLKVAWAAISYVLWDTAYTICDVPIYGLVTTMTDNQQERTNLNAAGRVCATLAIGLVTIVIPTFRNLIGGWTATVAVLSVFAAVTMIPVCFVAKERVKPAENAQEVGLREMMRYIKGNKFLLIYFVAFLIRGALNVANAWGLYIARFCLGNEAMQSLSNVLCFVPSVGAGLLVPFLCKKFDKFKLFYYSLVGSVVVNVIRMFIGYDNVTLYLVANVIGCIPGCLAGVLLYMFTPDCAEYGYYKSGVSCPGITFSIQTFFVKMESAIMTAFSAFVLAMMGFVSGEGAVQAEGFVDKLWTASFVLPTIGIILSLVILAFYKLNDHDVQLMAKCNSGEITREEAEANMKNKY